MGKFDQLIARMTVREKLAQLTQIMADCFWVGEQTPETEAEYDVTYGFNITDELKWNIGSVLGFYGVQKHHDLITQYRAKNRHHIPLLFMADVIHGYKTIFPSPLAMACSFDPQVIRRSAEIAAKEAAVAGVHVTFSPMCDLSRDARWGRVVECTGEDSFLNRLYATAFVQGYQGSGLKNENTLAACVKHFVGYGAAEGGRDYNTAEIGDYTLREFYLPAFKAAVDAGCKLVMTAFNVLNGTPCTGNPALLRGLLRDEWGFTGTVISDCTAVCEMVPHGFCENNAEAAQRALQAGVDIEMISTTYFENGENLRQTGHLDDQRLDEAVERVLLLKDELGLFDDPYRKGDPVKEKEILLCAEHRQAARQIAQKSMVLLENDGILPLNPAYGTAALIGPYAESQMLLDIWKCAGDEKDCIPLAQGLRGRLAFQMATGCEITGGTDARMDEAVALAQRCDYVILAVGEHPDMSAEAGSRAYLTLPGRQQELLDRLHETGKKIVTVIFAGRPLELKAIKEKSSALLYAWFPGTEGGHAVADILTGTVEPTGRLCMSFPYTVGQLPVYYNAFPTGRPKESDENTQRFASRYLDAPNAPLYVFGYGLGFGRFEYGPVALSADSLSRQEPLTASVRVKNIGTQRGTETVQLYLRDMAGSYTRPVKELKGYQAVTLSPGEEMTVSFPITEEMLRYHSREGYRAEPGRFRCYLGGDSATQNHAIFTLPDHTEEESFVSH